MLQFGSIKCLIFSERYKYSGILEKYQQRNEKEKHL